MDNNSKNKAINETIEKVSGLSGLNAIYFLNNYNEIIKEQNVSGKKNYLEQITNIIKLEPQINETGKGFYSKDFHTLTLLNENGLIIISRVINGENLHLVIIAGESEPVDLITLLKICKETRLNFQNSLNTN